MSALKRVAGLIKFFGVIGILAFAVYYMQTYHKELVHKLCLKFDVLGISEVGRVENQRIKAIDGLFIPLSQREALKNGTIFIDATKQMVTLALGPSLQPPVINENGQEVWVYYFGDYTSPTYLYFENDVLVAAEKQTRQP